MSTNKSNPIYKFASLRSPDEVEISARTVQISPTTAVVETLIAINEDVISSEEKLDQFNAELQIFIDSDSFVKTKVEFDTLKAEQSADPREEDVELLYNNILVRTLTKSSSNLIYKLVVDQLKLIYSAVYGEEIENMEIVIPERLNLTFSGFINPEVDADIPDMSEQALIVEKLNDLTRMQKLIDQAKSENVLSFKSEAEVIVRNTEFESVTAALGTSSVSVRDALSTIDTELEAFATEKVRIKKFNENYDELGLVESTISEEEKSVSTGINEAHQKFDSLKIQVEAAREAGVRDIEDTKSIRTEKYSAISEHFDGATSIEEAEDYVKLKMEALSSDLTKVVTNKQYSLVGDNWVETTEYLKRGDNLSELPSQALLEYPSDCNMKFPFQVADLRVIEQEPVGYLPGEIAHINNTQPGERNTKVTRRLKKVESFDSIISETEVFKETDTQSTDKFSLEREATNAQNDSQSFNINTSASAKFGAYSLSLDAGYASSSSSSSSNSTSQSHAKEVVQNIVDRVSNRVQTERSVKTIEEFEEIVTHEIDNSGQGTKSYVYRWLNKLVRATLKNYGKRLIYQFDVAHPAHYYLTRAIKELPSIQLPPDPRKLSVDGTKVLAIENLTRDNYLAWGAIYKTSLPQPPAKKLIVSETFVGDSKASTSKMISIKKGYECKTAKFTTYTHNSYPFGHHTILTIGNAFYGRWSGGGTSWWPETFWLRGETEQLPVSLLIGKGGFSVNIEVNCELSEEAYKAWKIKVFNALVGAYENLKAQADEQMVSFDPNAPGLHPAKKKQLIMDEIKRETIHKMFRCNPFWVNDQYVVGKEYAANCCRDSHNAEKVRFLERVFDWDNLTYELHPYFYADKNNWAQLLDLSDDDPHFESFLRSSFATIQVPVHRDSLKETAAVNFIRNNSIANYEVVPQDMLAVLSELATNDPTLFTFDLDGNELPEPNEQVDLGIFTLPTSLVILECGTSDGVKPIGFPQSEDEPTSDVIIPKQYSPAIIADSCDV